MSQNFKDLFFELGLSTEDTAEMLAALGVTPLDARKPDRILKLRTIAQFVKDMPNKHRFFSRLREPGIDLMDKAYEYCCLRLDFERVTKGLEETDSLLIDSPDDEVLRERKESLEGEYGEITKSLDYYER